MMHFRKKSGSTVDKSVIFQYDFEEFSNTILMQSPSP